MNGHLQMLQMLPLLPISLPEFLPVSGRLLAGVLKLGVDGIWEALQCLPFLPEMLPEFLPAWEVLRES